MHMRRDTRSKPRITALDLLKMRIQRGVAWTAAILLSAMFFVYILSTDGGHRLSGFKHLKLKLNTKKTGRAVWAYPRNGTWLGDKDSFGLERAQQWESIRSASQRNMKEIFSWLPPSGYYKPFKNPCWFRWTPYEGKLKTIFSWSYTKAFRYYRIQQGPVKRLNAFMPDKSDTRYLSTLKQTPPYLYCLPYFFVGGVRKSGTTDLYTRLVQHPQVMPTLQKEPHWWNKFTASGTSFRQYVEFHSYVAKQIKEALPSESARLVTGDGSACTICQVFVGGMVQAERIFSVLPRAKIIVILRNPVDRLWSDFRYFKVWKSNCTADKNQVSNWTVCLLNQFHEMVKRCNENRKSLDNFCNAQGDYYNILAPWIKLYPLNKQLLILKMEKYTANVGESLRRVFHFLELDPLSQKTLDSIALMPIRNPADDKEHRKFNGNMLPETRQLLEEYYAPMNRKLADLLHDEQFLWST